MLRKLWVKLEKISSKLKNKTGLSIVSDKSYRARLQNSHLHMFYKHQLELYIKRVKLYNIQCRMSNIERNNSIDRRALFRFHKIQRRFHTKRPSLILYSDQNALKKHIGKFDARKIQLDDSIQRQIVQYPANEAQRSVHEELIYLVFGPIIRQLLFRYRSSAPIR